MPISMFGNDHDWTLEYDHPVQNRMTCAARCIRTSAFERLGCPHA